MKSCRLRLLPSSGVRKLFRVGAVIAASLSWLPVEGALQVTFEKIVEVSPAASSGRQLGSPWFSNGAVYYAKTARSEDTGLWGIYRGTSQIASWGALISGAEANSLSVADASGSAVLISGLSNYGLTETVFKNTLNLSTGGAPTRILSSSSELPGYAAPHPGNPITGRATTDGSQVAFFINPYLIGSPTLKGAVALTGLSGTPVTILVREGDAVPNSGGVFSSFDATTRPFLNAGRVLFTGNGTLKKGIHEWSGGALRTVVDTSMNRPEGGTFSAASFASATAVSGGSDYAFTNGGTHTALYKKVGGQFALVANSTTAVPGGTGAFQSFGSPSIRNGKILCIGRRQTSGSPPTEIGIYTDLSGTLEPVVDIRTNLGYTGKTIDTLELATGKAWVGDDTLYFTVAYTDTTEAIFRARFSASASPLSYTAVFATARSGTLTVRTRVGYNYVLRKMPTLQAGGTVVSTTPGTGGAVNIPFSETDPATTRMFFRVEEVLP